MANEKKQTTDSLNLSGVTIPNLPNEAKEGESLGLSGTIIGSLPENLTIVDPVNQMHEEQSEFKTEETAQSQDSVIETTQEIASEAESQSQEPVISAGPEEKTESPSEQTLGQKVADANEREISKAQEEVRQKESFLKKLLAYIAKGIAKVGKVLATPFVKVGEGISALFIPKEVKQQIYMEAMEQSKKEYEKALQESMREDGRTIAKKMEIVRKEQSYPDSVRELAKLCHESKKNIIVKTKAGALMFEKVGDTVLIKHALPKQRTLNSNISYGFETLGSIAYNKLGLTAEVDIEDVIKQLSQDEGFDIHTRELSPNESIEDVGKFEYENPEQGGISLGEDANQAIAEGNSQKLVEAISEEIDVPDEKANDALAEGLENMEQVLQEQQQTQLRDQIDELGARCVNISMLFQASVYSEEQERLYQEYINITPLAGKTLTEEQVTQQGALREQIKALMSPEELDLENKRCALLSFLDTITTQEHIAQAAQMTDSLEREVEDYIQSLEQKFDEHEEEYETQEEADAKFATMCQEAQQEVKKEQTVSQERAKVPMIGIPKEAEDAIH